jgi:hypothetical protein
MRVRRSLAWIGVAAMSLVTAWAAELPQASGAKPPAKVVAPAARRLAPTDRLMIRRAVRRTPTVARRSLGRFADRR